MRRKAFLWLMFLLLAGAVSSARAQLPQSAEELAKISNLPVIAITTDDAQEPGDEMTYGSMTVFMPGTDGRMRETVRAGFRLRGNTSRWFPKKSLRVAVVDEEGEKQNLSIAGLRSDDDWILNPMYTDTSKIREALAYDVWDMMNRAGRHAASSRLVHVEVFVNGDYRGLYGLQERIDRKQVGGDKQTGILYKAERLDKPTVEQLLACTDVYCGGFELEHAGTGVEKPWEPAAAYMACLNGEETTIAARPDLDNLIDYGLWAMLTQAHDCHFKNQFIHCVRGVGGYTFYKIPWDVNNTFGDVWKNDAEDTNHTLFDIGDLVFDGLFGVLVDLWNPVADEAIRTRWDELRETVIREEFLTARAHALYDPLYDALQRDTLRWPDCGMGEGNAFNIRDIEQFIRENLIQMDEFIGSLQSSEENAL